MKFSIVMPVLNEAEILENTLRHVLSLKGDFEVLVIDGGSTDNTISIAGRYATILAGPRGRASQMNLGAEKARGDVLVFLHADTLMPEGALEGIGEYLANPAIIGGRFRVRLDCAGWKYRMIGSSINLRDSLLKGFTGDQAIFIRAQVFKDLGGYRNIPLMEDLELGRRMLKAGRVARLPQCVVTSARRWQKNGVTRTILLMWTLRLLFNLGCPPSFLDRFYGDAR